ncbi:MAG TPA: hypothetical protein VG291_04095, partial [Xanthobacteraceae bacterium]|nr:hypothetical protein [Xanthobacteraceae bacterium]
MRLDPDQIRRRRHRAGEVGQGQQHVGGGFQPRRMAAACRGKAQLSGCGIPLAPDLLQRIGERGDGLLVARLAIEVLER